MRWWAWLLVAWACACVLVPLLGWWAGHVGARARSLHSRSPEPPSRV